MGRDMQDLGALFTEAGRNSLLFLNSAWISSVHEALDELDDSVYPLRNTRIPTVIPGAEYHADTIADLLEEIVSTTREAVRTENYELLSDATDNVDFIPMRVEQANQIINRYLSECAHARKAD